MSGHLFITIGNLNTLRCDGMLLPSGTDPADPASDRRGHVLGHWDLSRSPEAEKRPDGAWWINRWPEDQDLVRLTTSDDAPETWVAHTSLAGNEIGARAGRLGRLVGKFLSDGASLSASRSGRARLLLAFPLIGAGAGGWQEKGAVIASIIETSLNVLRDLTEPVDAVFVAADRETFEAAQLVRSRFAPGPDDSIRRLARLARRRRLVLFLGAGTSSASGLPDWSGLLDALEGSSEHESTSGLDYLDRAELIGKELGQDGLLRRLQEELGGDHPLSLLHLLLASLPVEEVATTNYDDLFDRAWIDATIGPEDATARNHRLQPEIAELPSDDAVEADRWILKLHGSLKVGADRIVLTRGDYLRFERDAGALAGLVQAMLLTRHILFVGYSLSDPNFHRIVNDVRSAVGPARRGEAQTYGTVLTPVSPGIKQRLWEGEIDFVSAEVPEGEAESRRRVEILLDQLVANTAQPVSFLTDRRFDSLLDADERAVGAALSSLAGAVALAPPALQDALSDYPGLPRKSAKTRLRSEGSGA